MGSKTGLSGLDFDKVFFFGEYLPHDLKIGAATKVRDFWMGLEYSGNVIPWVMNKSEEPVISGDSVTEKEFTNNAKATDLRNELRFTGHLPNAVESMPMGFHVGFTLEGDHERGLFDENFSDSTRKSEGHTTAEYSVGTKNEQVYTPSVGYAVSVPLGKGLVLTPAVNFDMGIAPNSKEAAYKTYDTTKIPATTKDVHATEQKLVLTPKATLDLDLSLGTVGSSWHGTGVEYVFEGEFIRDATKEVADSGTAATVTQTQTPGQHVFSNAVTGRYTRTTDMSDRLKLGWQAKLGLKFTNTMIPGSVNDTAGYDKVVTTTTRTGGKTTVSKAGPSDGYSYVTDIFTVGLSPTINAGFQWQMVPDTLFFGAGVSLTPVSLSWTSTKTLAGDAYRAGAAQKEHEQQGHSWSLDEFSGALSMGFMMKMHPDVVFDTAFKLKTGSETAAKINDLLQGELNMAICVSL